MECINMIYDNLDLNSLKTFMCIYENNSISVASKKLFLSQPAVSISLKKLEEKLDGKLFIRLPKGIKPTKEGEIFYNYCKNAFNQISSGMLNFTEFSSLNSGYINIGASDSIIKNILMPQLKTFCQKYSNIKITFTEVITERLYKYLYSGKIDIAFIDGIMEEKEMFNCISLKKLNSCFAVSKSSNLESITINDLASIPLAIIKENTAIRASFDELCLNCNIKPNIMYEMASLQTQSLFCENNLSTIFCIKEFIKNNDKIKILKTDFELPKINLTMVTPKGNSNSFVCNKIIELFTK